MQISESRMGQSVTLYVKGNVDGSMCQYLQTEIFRVMRTAQDLTLDFKDVTFINDDGIAVLQHGVKATSSKRGRFTIKSANAGVKNELQTKGMGKYLTSW